MHKVILIDDEPLGRQLIRSLLKGYAEINVVAECADCFEGFKAIHQYQPELLFLDIQMPRVSGFEMLELLDSPPAVIFITAFDEFALKAFEAHAVDYLLKPVTKERFDRAMSRWTQRSAATASNIQNLLVNQLPAGYQNRIVVKDNGMIRIIPAQDIQYLEASDDYVRIFTAGGKYLKKCTLAHLEQNLDPKQFVRVHRSYLVPVNQLMRLEPYEKDSHIALLHCGAKVPVSKTGMSRLKSLLGW